MRDRREHARASAEVDRVRRLLCHEPRGHADMYGCFPVAPDDDGAELGVLFWHKDGFSTACGHGTIALGAWAVESGRVAAAPDGDDRRADRRAVRAVVARVRCAGGAVQDVTFRNVPSYVLARGVPVDDARAGALGSTSPTAARSTRRVPAAAAGLAVDPARYGELIALGREIKWRARRHRARPPPERRPPVRHLRDDPSTTTSATPRPGRTSAT